MGGRQNTFPKRALLQGEGLEPRGASIQETKRIKEAGRLILSPVLEVDGLGKRRQPGAASASCRAVLFVCGG